MTSRFRSPVPALGCLLLALLANCSGGPAAESAPSTLEARIQDAAAPSGGEALVRRHGCGVCHVDLPRGETVSGGAPIEPGTRRADSVFALFGGTARAGGTHVPGFGLGEGEALALALLLGGTDGSRPLRRARSRHAAADAAAGRRIFSALNCAGCHASSLADPSPNGPPLVLEGSRVRSGWLRSFLREPHAVRPFGTRPGSGGRMPDFGLSAEQADSIAEFLGRRTTALAAFRPISLSPFAAAKARTLLETRFSCLGCHAIDGEGGRIGPDLAVSARRLEPAFLRAILDEPQRLVPGSIMPPAEAPAATVDLIASYLAGLAVRTEPPGNAGGYLSLTEYATLEPAGDRAAATYLTYCAACHGARGGADGYNAGFLRSAPVAHTDPAAMAARTDDRIHDAIAAGARFLDRSSEMPAFGAVLEPEAVRSLVQHLRRLCDCQGPAWSRDGREAGR